MLNPGHLLWSEHQIAKKVQCLEKLEILFVIGSLEIGGAEIQMSLLVNHLKALGHSCQVFSFETGGPLLCSFNDKGVPVYDAGLKKGDLRKAPWTLIPAQWKLIKIIRYLRPSVVHSFLPLVTFMGAIAGRLTRIPLVITSRRAIGTHQERFFLLRPADLMANLLSHRVTVNSKAVLNDVVKRDHVKPEKLVLIYNGIDTAPFEDASRMRDKLCREMTLTGTQRVVTVVANLIPYKGHLDFLKAAGLVANRVPTASFWLVGEDRGTQNGLERAAFDFGIRERVRFMGQRHDIPNLLAVSDVSVLASHEEGFSNVILESMAAGVPVVATRVGGNPEAVVDGVTGWLVPRRNPEALAHKIIDLLNNPAKARKWGEEGRRRVKELFTVDRMVEGHLKLYGRRSNRVEAGDYSSIR